MHINGYKHPILWWICFGIPFIIYSCFPKNIKRKLFYKYSFYAKHIKNSNKLQKKIIMATIKIEDIFDKNGNFINPIDPYRCDRDNEIYQYLFDEDGYSLRTEEARKFILKHNCSPFSAIVHYYYSHYIDCGCKGNYTAVYAWR